MRAAVFAVALTASLCAALIVFMALALAAVAALDDAAPRGGPDPTLAGQARVLPRASYVPVPEPSPARTNVVRSERLASARRTTPTPGRAAPSVRVRGKATWYCGAGSRCPRGHAPGELVAAIDRKDTPWDKGDVVTVTYRGRSVTVRIVDVCACKGSRVIDLSAAAFRALAPLSRGVITVTVTGARTTPTLPPTDTED